MNALNTSLSYDGEQQRNNPHVKSSRKAKDQIVHLRIQTLDGGAAG